MKLIVILQNAHAAYDSIAHYGVTVEAPKRRVEIELTEEQASKLRPRIVGSANGQKIYEAVLTMFIEDMYIEEGVNYEIQEADNT